MPGLSGKGVEYRAVCGRSVIKLIRRRVLFPAELRDRMSGFWGTLAVNYMEEAVSRYLGNTKSDAVDEKKVRELA